MSNKIPQHNTLYVVGLPIGNLDDITFRAVHILQNVQNILVEDKRQFNKIKYKYNIQTPTISYHDFNEREKSNLVIENLMKKENYSVALVSDAGTPMISDPGYHIITKCYQHKIPVVPIPGVSAVTCGLSVAPFNGSYFTFIGFFEKDKIELIKNYNGTIVFFESPKRINNTLILLQKHISERKILIGREMTKEFESFYYFSLSDIPKIEPLGEFIVIIEPKNFPVQDFDLDINTLKKQFPHITNKDIIALISYITKKPKKDIYSRILNKI